MYRRCRIAGDAVAGIGTSGMTGVQMSGQGCLRRAADQRCWAMCRRQIERVMDDNDFDQPLIRHSQALADGSDRLPIDAAVFECGARMRPMACGIEVP